MTYYELLSEVENEGIKVVENCKIGKLKGLYFDNIISLSENIISEKEKKCILCEEIGHHCTSYGDILDQSTADNRQQERKARAWAFEKLVTFQDITNAYKAGIRNRYELAEFLGITEKFLIEAINYYKEKHGIYKIYNGYIIYFEPLGVLENLERS